MRIKIAKRLKLYTQLEAIIKFYRNYKAKAFCLSLCMAAIILTKDLAANQSVYESKNRKNDSISHIVSTEMVTEDSSKTECYVWFETNTESYLDKYIMRAEQWAFIGKPIVTARIFNIEAFTRRMMNAGIDVLGGFKTSNVLGTGDYCNENSWAQIAQMAEKISKITKGKPVVLENEGAVKLLMSRGIKSINYGKLLNSIAAQHWPEIWFWHGPSGQNEPLKTLSFDIARAIMNGIPNCRLIEANSAGSYKSSYNYSCKSNLERTFTLDPNPISIIYLDDHEANSWRLEDTDSAINKAAGNTVILYPGLNDIDNFDLVKKSIGKSNDEK